MKRDFLVPSSAPLSAGAGPNDVAGHVVNGDTSTVLGSYRLGKEVYWLSTGRNPKVLYLGRNTRVRLFSEIEARFYIDLGPGSERPTFDGLKLYVVDAYEYMAFGE